MANVIESDLFKLITRPIAQPKAMATAIRDRLLSQIAFQSALSCPCRFAMTNIQRTRTPPTHSMRKLRETLLASPACRTRNPIPRTIGTATMRINRPSKRKGGTDNANSAPNSLLYTAKTTDIEATDRRQETALTATDKATFPLAIKV